MLDFMSSRLAFEKYISDNFSTCPVKNENVPLNTSDLPAWIALFDKPSVSQGLGMGESDYLSGGNLVIQIFTPLDTGTQNSREIAQELADLLGSQDISGLLCQEPELHPVVPSKDATWYQANLIVPYQTLMGQAADNC